MNFRDSLNNSKYNNTNSNFNTNNAKKENVSETEIINNVNKYKNYSHDELMREFLSMTTKMKQNGELNSSKIKEIYKSLEPMLNEEQKNNLLNLLNMI